VCGKLLTVVDPADGLHVVIICPVRHTLRTHVSSEFARCYPVETVGLSVVKTVASILDRETPLRVFFNLTLHTVVARESSAVEVDVYRGPSVDARARDQTHVPFRGQYPNSMQGRGLGSCCRNPW
jgi:hypothetical protein